MTLLESAANISTVEGPQALAIAGLSLVWPISAACAQDTLESGQVMPAWRDEHVPSENHTESNQAPTFRSTAVHSNAAHVSL